MNKRSFVKSIIIGTVGVFASGFTSFAKANKRKKKWNGEFLLPELPYAYNALEPYIDARTMELHHSRHHATYTERFNQAVSEAGLTGKTAKDILAEVSKYPVAIRNNGGGYLNHKLFWQMLAPAKGQQPSKELSDAIARDFGSLDAFKDKFSTAAKAVFGSGWTWLILAGSTLKISSTPNQDNPFMDVVADRGFPLLCVDVWEHAYYLNYQNRRPDYITAFWNIVNWDYVSQSYEQQLKLQSK
jgi:Fe-Mn family superoxide dismutase